PLRRAPDGRAVGAAAAGARAGGPLLPRERDARPALRRLRGARGGDGGAAEGRGRAAGRDVRPRRHLPHRGRRPAGAGRCARHPGRRRGLRRRGRRLGHGPAGGVHRAGPAARLPRRRRRWCPLAARLPDRAGVRHPGAEHPPARPGRDGRPRPVARRLPRRAARRASGRRAARLIPRSAAPVGRSHLYRSRSTPMTLVLTELPAAAQEAVAATRERVAALHAELPRNDLVVWTAGNVSERVPTTDPEVPGLLVIKPSGVSYDELSAENMVVCTLDGAKIADGTPD